MKFNFGSENRGEWWGSMNNYSIHSITIKHAHYSNDMSRWAKALDDTHFVFTARHMVIYFSREEDLTAFKLTFKHDYYQVH